MTVSTLEDVVAAINDSPFVPSSNWVRDFGSPSNFVEKPDPSVSKPVFHLFGPDDRPAKMCFLVMVFMPDITTQTPSPVRNLNKCGDLFNMYADKDKQYFSERDMSKCRASWCLAFITNDNHSPSIREISVKARNTIQVLQHRAEARFYTGK
ncbi:hypothetical protein AAF712_016654 [Marasmius tenuissimus]|uniref:Uncharacterized protein n=1 Tax=Marasmius tenuissimus TaxID=585030 RepID=A0ABR2Z657_9AGAR